PPTATTFTDAQLHNLLVPRQDEVVLNGNRSAGENVPGVKGKKTILLAARNDFKSRKGLGLYYLRSQVLQTRQGRSSRPTQLQEGGTGSTG
ncbi:hypothetical protein C0992_012323, partial [Termitomyces sp. T32_za158]